MVVQMVGAAGGSMEVGRTRGTSHVSQPYIYFQQVFPFPLRAGIELGERSLGGDTEEIILVVVVLPYQPC